MANSLVQMETQVRQVINGAGEALAVEAAVLTAKWKARGLTEAVLQGIRTDVFNVSAPIAP